MTTNQHPAEPRLAQSMTSAWADKARRSRAVLATAFAALPLFAPDAVEQARREYAKATAETERWRDIAIAELQDGAP